MRVLFLTSHPFSQAANALKRMTHECIIHDTGKLTARPYCDLGISFLYNYLIPEEMLLPDRTWINFHPGLLPDYRGRNVAYHAIMNGETEFGATLHYVDRTFDTGDIIATKTFPILSSDCAGDVAENARDACLDLFYEYVPRFLAGEKPMRFRQLGGTYYKKAPIDPHVSLTSEQQRQVRAITAPPHYAKTVIGGVVYDIIPASERNHSDHESPRDVKTNSHAAV